MIATLDPTSVKVYTVNGAVAGSSSALPDWLTRKRTQSGKGKGKRVIKEHVEGTVELIQGFEFPEASNRIKTTRDGHHAIATGTYKPQMRVWDLDQLSLKFERHSDAENVDFIMLSEDWTKSVHLQNDRCVELHTQGGFHHRTRIPRFGRSLAYHFPSCDTYISASENEVYRLSLNQGRFMTPLILEDNENDILGVNVIDVNPAHQLLAFGIDAMNGSVQFWDPRSRSRVGLLRLPCNQLRQTPDSGDSCSVTALSSRADGLSYAVGTATGHTLLYDIRTTTPFAMKDQGYGLPIKNVIWIEGGNRTVDDGLVLSADKKVIKIWDRNSPQSNFVSVTPATDINHVHHVPGSGVILTANEGIHMNTYFIPQLGPAPRWATFLENITEEMADDGNKRSMYEDFKFLDKKELRTLGLDNLIGTPALKPYMHGYFVSLKLYETARLIANPFAYEEHRAKVIQEKMDKLAETRIRSKNGKGVMVDVKVNKALAEKVLKNEEKERKRTERRAKMAAKAAAASAAVEGDDGMDVDDDDEEEEEEEEQLGTNEKPNLLNDPRFKELFSNPTFAVDETTREYALLNPSSVVHKSNGRRKTAVEEEEEESDKVSSDGLGGGSDEDEDESSSDDSDKEALNEFDPRTRPGQKNARAEAAYRRTKEQNRISGSRVTLVPLQAGAGRGGINGDRNATFGQRRLQGSGPSRMPSSQHVRAGKGKGEGEASAAAGMEMSWIPSSRGDVDSETGGNKSRREGKGVERFGAGMERGGEYEDQGPGGGRTQRRKGIRSGSKNVFRQLDA